MKTVILDTNVLLRFIVGDHEKHQKQAARWFAQAERNILDIVVDPLIIAETAFVLESFYKIERDVIADSLEVFLSQRWLKVKERETLLDLWHYYRRGLHFVDSYLLTLSANSGAPVLTFDKEIKKKNRD